MSDDINNYSPKDIALFNLLRSEPKTIAFDFFGYGGLTRSVFKFMQEIPDLEELINSRINSRTSIITIPRSDSNEVERKKHLLCYSQFEDSISVIANSYNQFSKESDAKYFARAHIKGEDGKDYTVNLLALEIYRRKGNKHPIFGIGVYISDESRQILYGEESVVDVGDENDRTSFSTPVCETISLISKMSFNPNLKDINRSNKNLKYLNHLVNGYNLKIISHQEFNEKRSIWFRYLAGTNAVEKVLKFEDRYGYKRGFRNYRIELISSHLTSVEDGRFNVNILANTEGDPNRPNERMIKDGSNLPSKGEYCHEDAIDRFLTTGQAYLTLMHINAGKGEAPFEIAIDKAHIDFRYATIIGDKNNLPVTISSWETPLMPNGQIYPDNKVHYYLQLWGVNPEDDPLILEEGIDFEDGNHPRNFMNPLKDAMHSIDFNDIALFKKQAIDLGIPFRL